MNRFLSLPHTLLVIRSLPQANGNISCRLLLKCWQLISRLDFHIPQSMAARFKILGFCFLWFFFFYTNLLFFFLIDFENCSCMDDFLENPLREKNGMKEVVGQV